MESKPISFGETFDSNLCSILCPYLKFEELTLMMKVDRSLNDILTKKLDFIWKSVFMLEFQCYSKDNMSYLDHKRDEGETYFQYFKRSFMLYQRMRAIIKPILENSLEYHDGDYRDYLKPFNDRALSSIITQVLKGPITFEYECLYKNLVDSEDQTS